MQLQPDGALSICTHLDEVVATALGAAASRIAITEPTVAAWRYQTKLRTAEHSQESASALEDGLSPTSSPQPRLSAYAVVWFIFLWLSTAGFVWFAQQWNLLGWQLP